MFAVQFLELIRLIEKLVYFRIILFLFLLQSKVINILN